MPQAAVEMGLPCRIGDYTDFYTSIHHATSGRQAVPSGQSAAAQLQVGADRLSRTRVVDRRERRKPFAGRPANSKAPTTRRRASGRPGGSTTSWSSASSSRVANDQGEPVPIAEAEAHLFGLALFNDWTARDIQAWEYQPLGPFLSKNFASTLSPWIVTLEALAPFRAPFARPAGEPAPLPYLDSPGNRATGAIDIALEVWLQTAAMRNAGLPAQRFDAVELPRQLLDARAARRSPHGQWLQSASRRPPRFRHAVRTRSGPGRLAARALRRRQASRCSSPMARRAVSSKMATP